MSATNAAAYCEEEDVQEALQQADSAMTGSLATANVEAAIFGASRWLRTNASAHWYDSNAAGADLISSSGATITGRTYSVPSSPHAQRGQLFRADRATAEVQYPKLHTDTYTRIDLGYRFVESIDTLNVRDYGGEQTDWVADASFTEGRGDDYFLQTEGGARGRSYLYLHGGSLGAHTRFEDLLEVDLTYGRDWANDPWDDVRRGVAALAAAQLVTDDDVITQIPDQGQLIGVETQAQQLLNIAFSDPGYLTEYQSAPVA